MVDFSKKLNIPAKKRVSEPNELYASLDRRSDAGPLRPAQEAVLEKWYCERKEEKDLIIKLHTGEGKTLVGLLMLASNMYAQRGPSLYVCPNKYLMQQVCGDASKFGIPYCTIPEDNTLPNDFLDSKSVLITYVQKVFNGLSIFGVGNSYTELGTMCIDDSHACVESIRDSFTMRIPSNSQIYSKIKDLFEPDLQHQSQARYFELDLEKSETIMSVPYWCISDKKQFLTKILAEGADEQYIKYCWPLLRDSLKDCHIMISGRCIEISPFITPIEKYKTFTNAKQRILMSATTQNDAFFIKGLGISENAIVKPITYEKRKWSGEKMILIPSLMADNFDREYMIAQFSKRHTQKFGIVAITPSFRKSQMYVDNGAMLARDGGESRLTVFDAIKKLKQGHYENVIVFANRYDGIDLPDRSCRLLILDSLPYADSLIDQYEEKCRANSKIVMVRMAQKIEQGLGRSVRGEKDYSIILVIGADLVRFIKSSKTNFLFSAQTKKQIEIGLEIANMAQNESETDRGNSDIRLLFDLINQSLLRDESWKSYYVQQMDTAVIDSGYGAQGLIEILRAEHQAEEAYKENKHRSAVDIIQKLLDNNQFDNADRGWYLQMMGKLIFPLSKSDSQKYQESAFTRNYELLRPIDELKYGKIPAIDIKRSLLIKDTIVQSGGITDFLLHLDEVFSSFAFEIAADAFENAVQQIGSMIGFQCQRPDKTIGKGPDNLWYVGSGLYCLIECKSEMETTMISKKIAGQCDQHCGWFESEYPKGKTLNILICPTNKLNTDAYFTHPYFIMRKSGMFKLQTNIRAFFREFVGKDMEGIDDSTICRWLSLHELNADKFEANYLEMPKQ